MIRSVLAAVPPFGGGCLRSILKIANFAEHNLTQTGVWNAIVGNRWELSVEDRVSASCPAQVLPVTGR
jgi:hypothetical protein